MTNDRHSFHGLFFLNMSYRCRGMHCKQESEIENDDYAYVTDVTTQKMCSLILSIVVIILACGCELVIGSGFKQKRATHWFGWILYKVWDYLKSNR